MYVNDFLEKYQNISFIQNPLFRPYGDVPLNQTIYNKEEFNELALPKIEKKPSQSGELMRHQKIISRYLSTNTIYNQLLLVHEPGTGKSCSAIGTIEKIRKEKGSTIKGSLVIVRNKALADNLINELVFVCTDGEYIPENYDILTPGEKVARLNKSIRKFYSFKTNETFAKSIDKMSDEEIIKEYSNLVVVIDEAHNLRVQSGEEQSIYNSIHRFLHLIKNSKVILMSGTPMKDKPEEIGSIMNLILPLNQQLPIGEQFKEEYLEEESEGIYKVKENKKNDLKDYLNGRVSYLKGMQNEDVNKKFIGEYIEGLKYFKVDEDEMEDFQSKAYSKAYLLDVDTPGESGIYSNSRQASLFVYPDGSWGSEGFQKYISKKEIKTPEGKSIFKFTLTQELIKELRGKDDTETLQNLKKFSSKYHKVISQILEGKNKNTFVYGEFVQGSGIILFSKILELFNFKKANGSENQPGLRYSIISNLTTSTKGIKKIISKFNSKENKEGEIIQVIIGSSVIGEGFSLKNVQNIHILTPHWNYSETDQAIARGFRLFSHQELGTGITVNIYLHASISKGVESIDLMMYLLSEKKDVSIKSIERLIKESAFDCALNKLRNQMNDNFEGLRECDYQECNYTCDDVELDEYKQDLLTYNLFYSEKKVEKIILEINKMFKNKFSLSLNEIQKELKDFNNFQILEGLEKIISEKMEIIDKFGRVSYLNEMNNLFYLTTNLSSFTNFSDSFYTEKPILKSEVSFEEISQYISIKEIPKKLQDLIKVKSNEEKEKILRSIPLDIQELLLEASVIAENKKIKENQNFRKFLLTFYKDYIKKVGDIQVSNLLKREKGILRCLDEKEWQDCPENFEEKFEEISKEEEQSLEENKYGYYSIIEKKTNKFLIRDVSSKELIEVEDDRKKSKGKVCNTWKREDLTKIAHAIKLEVDNPNFCKEKKKEELIALTEKTKYKNAKLAFSESELKKMNLDDLCRVVYWAGEKKERFCKVLQDWFISNNLVKYI
jgi:superfamily II DNA or RNA helicase